MKPARQQIQSIEKEIFSGRKNPFCMRTQYNGTSTARERHSSLIGPGDASF